MGELILLLISSLIALWSAKIFYMTLSFFAIFDISFMVS